MTVLLSKKSYPATRRCNATCHNARGDKCECICGGKLHGTGVTALELVDQLTFEEDVKVEPHQMALMVMP